ncbi:MAG: RHS repeat-associated core domain-containing protein, partial [Sphingorhabdus sp.]|uniref:RHS repeat-associated core domain-containing protein n=1 Tax=Sphingorhabdus sp. TaxID=1902408 RepID=UPI003C9B6746
MGMTYPDGAQVKIGRNQMRQATDLTVTLANGQTKSLLASAVYYPFGPVGQWTYGNGRTLQRSLNQNYQPGYVEDSGAGGISEGYWFDAAGNLESLRNANQQDPAKRKYEYDGLDRLTHVRDGASNAVLQRYDYDKTGNRSSRTDGAATTAYTYAPGRHRLIQVGTQHRGYDAAGNTTRIGGAAQAAASQPTASPAIAATTKPQARPRGLRTEVWSRKAANPKPARQRQSAPAQTTPTTQALTPTTIREFVYDDTDRMRQVKHDGVVAMNYLYNGLGERVYKTGSGQTVTTVYDEEGHWIGDYDANGQPIKQAIWLDDLPVGLLVGAGANQKLFYIEADALGTPRVVIDPDRNVAVWRWDLANEAFGDSAPNQDPDADGVAFVFDMRFPGQRYDSATGLNYNYYRDYEAGTGRYAESDPIGLDGGMSTYGYADGSPLMYDDPEGLVTGKVGGFLAQRLLPRLLPGIGFRLGATHAVRRVSPRVARDQIERLARKRVSARVLGYCRPSSKALR